MGKSNHDLSPTLQHSSTTADNLVVRSKANSQTKSKTSPLAKVQSLTLFGSPQLVLLGEDPTAYDELLGRAHAAVKPVDIIDEMLIADVVSLEWEILRWRRLKSSLMQMRALNALESFLAGHLNYAQHWKFFEEDLTEILRENLEDQAEDAAQTLAHKCARDDPDANDRIDQILTGIELNQTSILDRARVRKAEQLAQDYVRRKPGAIKLIDKLLDSAGLSINALMVQTLPDALDNIERIDRLATIAETRRNAMLREIDRRRAALGEGLRRHVQEVEGEFEVIEKTEQRAPSDQ